MTVSNNGVVCVQSVNLCVLHIFAIRSKQKDLDDWETVAPLVEEAYGLYKLLEALDGKEPSEPNDGGSVRYGILGRI